MMRYILHQAPVLLRDLDGTPILKPKQPGAPPERIELTLAQFVAGRLRDPVFGQSLDAVEACAAILAALVDLAPAQALALPEGAWRLLVHAVRTPHARTQYDPVAALNVLPFMRAIVDATTEPPTETTAENGAGAPAN